MKARTDAHGTKTTKRKRLSNKRPARAKKGSQRPPKRISRSRKPDDLSLEQWQVALRRQFGQQQDFRLKNVGAEPIFSNFEVTNPQTERTYRVAIRGAALGENFCSCPDFAVNTLGTCKHVEFTLAKLGRKRGGKKALALGFQPDYSQIYLHYGAQREVVFRPGTECPKQLRTYARRFFDESNRLKPDAFAQFHTFMKRAAGGDHELRCYDDTLQLIAEVRDGERLDREVAAMFPRGNASPAWKKLLKTTLYPYQRVGALFAAKAGRCLLADDMGLGKTIEAIAAVEILARRAGIERVLVVSPTSLKHQWKQEIEKFTDREALVVEGLLPRRKELYAAESFYKLTNYDVIHRDMEAIERWQPEMIILDEAQRIKNWKTRTAQSVKRLQSQYTIVLTGTPLENRLEELHSIVEFIDRFRLGPMFRFLAEHQHVDEGGRVVGYRNLSNISKTLAPILIRRTKDEVLSELPERLDKQFFVPMTPQQTDYHAENQEIVAKLVAKWRRCGFLTEADQLRLRICLQNMRMACNSTYLLDKKTDHGFKADEVADLLGEIFERPDAKVVVFSQWVRMHELLSWRLKERKWGHVMFNGSVPGPKRKKLIDRFKEDSECRLFLSTDAGGVGLNLQNASVVVNLDQPWNPAVLEQRIGRVHRLGQKRPVSVFHFIAKGTIEEGMLKLLSFKSAMAAGVLDGGKDEIFLGKTPLRKFMESVEKVTGAIPESMPLQSEPTSAAETAAAEVASPLGQPDQAWADVLSAGASLLEKLGQAFNANSQHGSTDTQDRQPTLPGLPNSLVAQDDQTGQPYLKLPMPEPETVKKIIDLFGAFTGKK